MFTVIIRFPDQEIERRALGFLARRFSGKSYATGETIVPEAALAELALEGIKFTVEGPATYERRVVSRSLEIIIRPLLLTPLFDFRQTLWLR